MQNSCFSYTEYHLTLDDVMDDAYKHSGVQRLVIGGSHHDGVSVILTAQDVFPDGRHLLVCRKNISHLAVFHLGFKQDQMRTLSQQTFPNTPTKLSDIYKRLLGLTSTIVRTPNHNLQKLSFSTVF